MNENIKGLGLYVIIGLLFLILFRIFKADIQTIGGMIIGGMIIATIIFVWYHLHKELGRLRKNE